MYCSSNEQVMSSMLLGQRRRRPVCRMLKVDILGRQADRESLSALLTAPFDVAGLPQ